MDFSFRFGFSSPSLGFERQASQYSGGAAQPKPDPTPNHHHHHNKPLSATPPTHQQKFASEERHTATTCFKTCYSTTHYSDLSPQRPQRIQHHHSNPYYNTTNLSSLGSLLRPSCKSMSSCAKHGVEGAQYETRERLWQLQLPETSSLSESED